MAANEFVAMSERAQGTYNVALGGRMSINDLATKIVARGIVTDKNVEIRID